MSDDLFLEDDGRNWLVEQPALPPKPGPGYGVYTLEWLACVLPIVRSADQLAVALMVYRRCVIERCRTISLPNVELSKLGVSRYTKYRALAELQEAGALLIEGHNGRAVRVTLHCFP